MLFKIDEFVRERYGALTRSCDRHRDRLNETARTSGHDLHLVGEIDRFLDIVGDKGHRLSEIAP
jgi:hypothetical protein